MDANAAEQRANAVAKLRRAASLPRMKDGRRPPMHGEAVSEGERSDVQNDAQIEGTEGDGAEERQDKAGNEVLKVAESKRDGDGSADAEGDGEADNEADAEGDVDADERSGGRAATREVDARDDEAGGDAEGAQSNETPTPTPTKRRSRQRSRSRGSREYKAKMRALESSSQATYSDTADEQLSISPPFTPTPELQTLLTPSPQAAYFMQMAQQQLSPFAYAGVSPGTPVPMPSLHDIRTRHLQGLIRSNSAAARMMAMSKLTGEPLNLGQLAQPDGASGVSRHNTVSGGERVEARRRLLQRLNERIEKTDNEQTSGNEESFVVTTKSRRRRSKRKSQTAVVDDRETGAAGTSASQSATTASSTRSPTPAPSTDESAAAPHEGQPAQQLPLSRSHTPLLTNAPLRAQTPVHPQTPIRAQTPMRAQTPVRAQTPIRSQTPVRSHTPILSLNTSSDVQRVGTPGLGVGLGFDYNFGLGHGIGTTELEFETPMSRRGVVVEDQEDDDLLMRRSPPPRGAMRSPIAVPSVIPIPGVLGTPSHMQQQLFPVSHSPSHSRSSSRAQQRPFTPIQSPRAMQMSPHIAPSMASSESSTAIGVSGQHVPVMLSDPQLRSPYRQDVFPKSPFGTPIKERLRDDDEERVLYPEASSSRLRTGPEIVGVGAAVDLNREESWISEPDFQEPEDREISWAADLVPEARLSQFNGRKRDPSWIEPNMPVYDEDEEDEENEERETEPSEDEQPPPKTSTPPRDSATSQSIVVEQETPTDDTPSFSVPSQHSTLSTITNLTARESNISSISGISGNRGDTSSAAIDRAPSQADSLMWDDTHNAVEAVDLKKKRSNDNTGGAWSRMRNVITRSGSSLGRRSRTNSIAKKGDTESGRESGASLVSGRRESHGEASGSTTIIWQQGQGMTLQGSMPIAPSPSASASMSSLAPPPRTGVSPIPPPSDTDAAKYADPKLFPFPGMVKLQEETLRNKAMSAGATSPDGLTPGLAERPILSSNSSSSGQSKDVGRERKISHQASDSKLLPKFQAGAAPAVATSQSAASHVDYFTVPAASSTGKPENKLPTTREGVKKWLRKFSPGSNVSTPQDHKPVEGVRKPSLSELLGRRDAVEIISDTDEGEKTIEVARAPTSASTNTVKGDTMSREESKDFEVPQSSPDDITSPYGYGQSIRYPPAYGQSDDIDNQRRSSVPPPSSSQDPVSSTTPDPASSADESAGRSLSHSSQASESSLGSVYSPLETTREAARAGDILERIDQILRSDDLNRLWSSAIYSPPRRLLLSSPMLQVVNANIVKDRFLFLFTDVLVIAKPILPARNSLVDNPNPRPYPPDRTFVVKNVVHLRDLKINVDRDDEPHQLTSALIAQRPEFLRRFIAEFDDNPDLAVAKIVDLRMPRGYATLGQLLVQLPELNRAKLGAYLSRRTSRNVLKAYLDAFGFAGLPIETALRIFLLSIHIPPSANTLEILLDTFAGRWYEANAGVIAFDRDLAVRLARAIVRLNEALHSAIAQESGVSAYSRHIVIPRDFVSAFRAHDPRKLVPDSMLEDIYTSVRQEKLCQARDPSNGRSPISISLKRSLPSRITYKRQSEPIVVRIPQPDALLRVRLYGQDLVFEPSELTFARSSEASFRATGTSLGPKTAILACAGPSAPNYVGLPLSTNVVVERAFMRNTFQIAFLGPNGDKRKYMFSVDDPVIRHEWTSSLKRQMEVAKTGLGGSLGEVESTSEQMLVYRAAEALSFKVLQDTLLSRESNSSSTGQNGAAPQLGGFVQQKTPVSPSQFTASSKVYPRSQSRSQIYRLGAGRHEQDLPNGAGSNIIPQHLPEHASDLPVNSDVRMWTSGELEMLCQQNSAIALVLSLLQAASPYDVDEDLNPTLHLPISPIAVHRRPSQLAYQI